MNISVAGMMLQLAEISKKELKGALIDDIARFCFYRTELAGTAFVLLISKLDANETPAVCAKISDRLSALFSMPVVFYFSNLKFYERQRYIEKGVFCIQKKKNPRTQLGFPHLLSSFSCIISKERVLMVILSPRLPRKFISIPMSASPRRWKTSKLLAFANAIKILNEAKESGFLLKVANCGRWPDNT